MGEQVSRKLQPILKSTSDICEAYVAGILGDQQSFASWIREGSVSESRVLYQGMGFNYVVFGMYLLQTERLVKLEVLCDQMREAFSVFSNQLGLLHMHLLRAAAVCRLYGTAAAMPALRAAVEIGREDAILLPFGEYSPHILDVLLEIRDQDPGDRYLEELAAFTLDYCTMLIDTSADLNLHDSLTKREREVLRLIAAGLTNADIASRLCVAEVTVRKNVTALYRKLEVTGRSLAVKKAIELGIT
jgi:LuxR family maltose regulon positive regulatory protein